VGGGSRPRREGGAAEDEARQVLGDVLRKCRHAGRFLGIGRIKAQHVAVVLDRRAAAGSRDDDRVEAAIVDELAPAVHVAAGKVEGIIFPAHVMDERAATAFTWAGKMM